MKTWKTHFYRFNSYYNPMIEQHSDVVFQTDIPFEDETLDEFIDVAWKVMWDQNPHFKNPAGGWSSVLGGREFVEIKKLQ